MRSGGPLGRNERGAGEPNPTSSHRAPVTNLLLPTTDGGVLVQLIVVTIAFGATTWRLRRQPEWRLLAIGLWLTAYGAIGLRSLH